MTFEEWLMSKGYSRVGNEDDGYRWMVGDEDNRRYVGGRSADNSTSELDALRAQYNTTRTDAQGRPMFGTQGYQFEDESGQINPVINGASFVQVDPAEYGPEVINYARQLGIDLTPNYNAEFGNLIPQNELIRYQKAVDPETFLDKWGAFPMLAAVIGGATYAGMGAAEGAAAGGSAGAGSAAGSAGASTLPQSYWSMLADGGAVASDAAPAAAGTMGGATGAPFNIGEFYSATGAMSPELAAAQAGTGAFTGSSLAGGALLDPAAAALGSTATAPAVMSGMNWAGLSGAATGLGEAASAANTAAILNGIKSVAPYVAPSLAQLGGAAISANATRDAMREQSAGANAALAATSQAAQSAIGEQQRQYDLNRADYAPYREVGNQAVGRINGMLAPGGDLTRRFTVGDFYADPVTQLSMDFGLSEGRKALERAARANGSLNAGGTLKALTRYGTDYAGQRANESYNRFYGDQDRTFNRNASLAGLGQTATAGTVNAGQNSANNIAGITTNQGNTIGNLYSSLGNSRGAASIAQGNTFNNALSNIGNWWTNQNMLDSLLKART